MAPPGSRDRGPFLALMAANAVSQVGHMMTALAVPWLVLETTGSPVQVGLTGAAIAIGAVAPRLLGGPLVDRLGPRRTSVAADLVSGVTVATIALLQLLGVLPFWLLLVLVFVLSSVTGQGESGRFALIPGLASRASMSLERSNATDRGIARAGQLIGPLLAGVLIPVVGVPVVLLLDAATFAFSAAVVFLRVPSVAAAAPAAAAPAIAPDQAAPSRDYRTELSEGLRFVIGNRLILSMMVLCLVGNFFDLPLLNVVLTVYAGQVFGGPGSLGLMLGSFAAGSLAGTILFGAIGRSLPRRRLFLWGWFLAVVITYGALVAQLPLAGIVLAGVIGGLLSGPINPILAIVVQENTPPQLLGRVFGAVIAIAQAGIPFGAAIVGFAIERAGLLPTIAVAGTLYLVVIALMFANPALRRMDARVGEEPVAEPTHAQASVQARRSATMKAGL